MAEVAELRGPELARAAINQILDHPEQWNQQNWHFGTTHCFAGWCQILAGKTPDASICSNEVRELLGVDIETASWMFDASRTLGELHEATKLLLAGESIWDAAGRDRDGRDRDGYDRAGYDRAGYDRDGYDRDGRDRAGYDRAGYDRNGYDRDGQRLEKL